MVGEQDGTQLGEVLRRILEGGEHEHPLVEAQREQLHLGVERMLEQVGQLVARTRAASSSMASSGTGRPSIIRRGQRC